MSNLIDWITECVDGESIEGVVIGKMGWGDYGSKDVPQYETQQRGVVLSWEEAKPMLDYEFNNGFGFPACNPIYVWTTTRVMFVLQYDGSTSMSWIPRNPTAVMPGMPGG